MFFHVTSVCDKIEQVVVREGEIMDKIWIELYQAAKAVQNPREISERIYAGGVAAAIESTSGKIYTGVQVYMFSVIKSCTRFTWV